MSSPLLLLGYGAHSRVVADAYLSSSSSNSVCFLDDKYSSSIDTGLAGFGPLIGAFSSIFEESTISSFPSAFVAIGDPFLRMKYISILLDLGYFVPVIKHPTSVVSSFSSIQPGVYLGPHSCVQSCSHIDAGCIINTSSSVDHDCRLSPGVHICPGARLAGEVTVGSRSWIGIGASVIQQITIGSDVTVGAGAAVVQDVPNCVTVVGVPARVLSSR